MKKTVVIILSVVLTVAVAATVVFAVRSSSQKAAAKVLEETEVIRFKDEAGGENEVSLTEIKNYEFLYAFLNSHVYYEKLNEKEQLLYRVFEYAFEKSYSDFFVDDSLLPNGEYTDLDILIMLTLDHPLIEQNFVLETKKTKITREEPFFLGVETATRSGLHYYIDRFCSEVFEANMKAFEKAKIVVENMPGDLTDIQKVQYLYEYLCQNTAYKKYNGEKPISYLADCFELGETHCDGFSNAFSLFLNLAGIRCCEKDMLNTHYGKVRVIGDDKSEVERYETPSGHTWSFYCLDGKWYNADASVDSKDSLQERKAKNTYFGLGFPDGFESVYSQNEYQSILPKSEIGFMDSSVLQFSTVNDDGIVKKVYSALKNSENGAVVLTFEKADVTDLRNLAKRVCDYGGISVYYGRKESNPILVYYAIREK